MPALADEMEVDVAERRPEPVRVVRDDDVAGVEPDLELVAVDRTAKATLEEPGAVPLLELDPVAVGQQGRDPRSFRPPNS